MPNHLQNPYFPRDPLHIALVLDLALLKDLYRDLMNYGGQTHLLLRGLVQAQTHLSEGPLAKRFAWEIRIGASANL